MSNQLVIFFFVFCIKLYIVMFASIVSIVQKDDYIFGDIEDYYCRLLALCHWKVVREKLKFIEHLFEKPLNSHSI
jgi:hypothetical protein